MIKPEVAFVRSASELPCDRRQVYNIRQCSGEKTSQSCSHARPDPFFDLAKQCKEDNLPGGKKFVRSVNIDTTPSCVLTLDT